MKSEARSQYGIALIASFVVSLLLNLVFWYSVDPRCERQRVDCWHYESVGWQIGANWFVWWVVIFLLLVAVLHLAEKRP